jgi:hypothetical protein
MLASLQNRAETQRLTVAGHKMTRHLFDVERTAREVAQIYGTLTSTPLNLVADSGETNQSRTFAANIV